MFWHYRIVKIEGLCPSEKGYGLYEVYYDDDWDKPFMRTQDAFAWGETPEEVVEVLEMMLRDAKKSPVINDEDIKEENDSFQ
jgi:hypothetical protein